MNDLDVALMSDEELTLAISIMKYPYNRYALRHLRTIRPAMVKNYLLLYRSAISSEDVKIINREEPPGFVWSTPD